MSSPIHTRVRALLRSERYDDGLTLQQMALILGHPANSLFRVLNTMPDAHIDRWTKVRTGPGRYAAVWCVVVPPPNCPAPNDDGCLETLGRYQPRARSGTVSPPPRNP